MAPPSDSSRKLPHWGALLAVFVLWCLFFHVVGNSSFGYVRSPSLFGWLNGWYHLATVGESGDELCPLVPVLALGLMWSRRQTLLEVPKRVWPPGLLLVGAAVAIHVAAFLVQQVRISGFAFLLGGAGLMATIWGPAWLRAIAFPWFLLIFAIPLDAYTSAATFPLRLFSTALSAGFCKSVLGLKLIRQGTAVFHDASPGSPGFAFDVVAACSGIRSASVILLISLVHAFLYVRNRVAQILVVLAAIPLAVLGNVVRLILVFVVGSALGEGAAKTIETRFGFVTYGCAVVGVILLGRFLQRRLSPRPTPAATSSLEQIPPVSSVKTSSGLLPPLAIATLLIASGWIALNRVKDRQHLGTPGVRTCAEETFSRDGRIVRPQSVRLPQFVPGYTTQPGIIDDTEWTTLPPDTLFGRMLYARRSPAFAAQLSVILMGADRTSIHQPEFCLQGNGWDVRSQSTRTIPFEKIQGGSLDVRRLDARSRGRVETGSAQEEASVYVYWFVADGQRTASHWTRTWWMTRDLLTQNVLQRWAYVSVFARCKPGEEDQTFDQICELIRATVPEFQLSGFPPR